ncbi:YwdI family protein [Lysinibacillus sp. NPDC097195]|uniref:YwdI family protein n=1 Tax=Lysinibacillus sp. NPDC097195 TaxID=3364141 RepID=UPI00380A186B
MISYEAVIQQVEKQLAGAKNANNEQQIREALTAIRALCDVVLDLPTATSNGNVQVKQHLPQMLSTEQMPSTINSSKIQHNDGANGDSIFDF